VAAAVSAAVAASRDRVAAQPFKASLKYNGSVDGMVYRTGTEGLGYYPDVEGITVVSLQPELFPLDDVTPLQLSLLPFLPMTTQQPEQTAGPTPSDGRTPPTVGPDVRRTQSRGARRTMIERDCDMEEDRNHADWPQHDAVSVKSNQHRTDGNWAIDTVNPDGWGNILEYLKATTADFVVGQEAKRAGKNDCSHAESAARTAGWKTSVTPCLTTRAMGKSAGVAVAARARVGLSDADPVTLTQHLHDAGRFGMKHVGAVRTGGFHLGSLYLYHTIGVRAEANLNLLETVACTLAGLKGPWCIGGDFNCTPSQLIDTGWLAKVGGVIHYPADATTDGQDLRLLRHVRVPEPPWSPLCT